MAPLAEVTSKWVTKPAGQAVPVTFSEPIARVSYAGHTARGTGTSLKLPEKAKAGTVKVAVAARPWEKLGDPTTVHYFPAAKRPVALVNPAPGGRLDPGDQVRVTFSTKAAQPKIDAPATGSAPTPTRTSSPRPARARRWAATSSSRSRTRRRSPTAPAAA